MARRPSLLNRLLGLETEYALRFAPERSHPGNDTLFRAIKNALGRIVATRPGDSAPGRDQLFLQNGGAFYYEYLPHCLWGGLVEGATPECRGPGQALLYQKAQEALLKEALPVAEAELRLQGYGGELGLLKNSRDAEGHIYGSQENYEASVGEGLNLWLFRCGVVLLLPVLAVQTVLTYLAVVLVIALVLFTALVMLFVPIWRRRLEELSNDQRQLEIALGRFQLWFTLIVTWPITTLFAQLLRLLAFRRIRRQILAFLVTRSILVGCGSVDAERRFNLSEKAQAIRQLIRTTILPDDRPIFDTGNLIKMLAAPFNLQIKPVGRLFRQRQRLQLNIADANRAQVAEYLKIGTASLVLDMIEDGYLPDAPRLRQPLEALQELLVDPGLKQRFKVKGGSEMSAVEIQRFYLERAREYIRAAPAVSMEARQVVRLWGEVLDDLEAGRWQNLIGRLDWVTKRFLLENCEPDGEADVLKTLDLRYHELGDGYYDRLEDAGETDILVSPDDVERATREPPADTPALIRGDLIRREAFSGTRVVVGWDSAYVGPRFGGKVIPFRRPERENEERSGA